MLSLFLEIIRHIFAAVGMVGTKNNFPKALTREEEAALVARLSSGDTAARDELIERNLRLVAHIAKKYSGRGRDSDDLISIGSIGLVKAIGTFNTEKGGSVAAYAARCIENAILSQRNKLNLEAKASHYVAKNGTCSVTYADTGMSCYATYHTK